MRDEPGSKIPMTVKSLLKTVLPAMIYLVVGLAPVMAGNLPFSKEEKEWLRRVDVLITSEERRDFKKRCTTRAQRKNFIQTFWARRDPDLSDAVNPFKQEFLARLDYVMTHYERKNAQYPTSDRSIVFLLLGKPTRIDQRIDNMLVGFNYRNPFLAYPPELWYYRDPPLSFKRKYIKIQMLATNEFGDYRAYMDSYVSNMLRTLKYRFIVHPELEDAPVSPVSAMDFQDEMEEARNSTYAIELTRTELDATQVVEPDDMSEEIPRSKQVEEVSEPEVSEEKVEVLAVPPPSAATDPSAAEGEGGTVSFPPKQWKRPETEAPKEAPPKPKKSEKPTELAVPSVTSAAEEVDAFKFDASLPNALDLNGRLAYFKNSAAQSLVLGRVGFPMKSLTFNFQDGQFSGPFILKYALVDERGTMLHVDRVQNESLLPNKRLMENAYFSKELALILPSGRFTLKMELEDVNGPRSAYHEVSIEVPPLSMEGPAVTQLHLMDPNVDSDSAKFKIQDVPFGLHLTHVFEAGDKIHPVLEIVNEPTEDELDTIRFGVLQNEVELQSWLLYPEEITDTPQKTLFIHPVLRLDDELKAGDYLLRFEIELSGGEILISETELTIK